MSLGAMKKPLVILLAGAALVIGVPTAIAATSGGDPSAPAGSTAAPDNGFVQDAQPSQPSQPSQSRDGHPCPNDGSGEEGSGSGQGSGSGGGDQSQQAPSDPGTTTTPAPSL
jgi:hypothetical protein